MDMLCYRNEAELRLKLQTRFLYSAELSFLVALKTMLGLSNLPGLNFWVVPSNSLLQKVCKIIKTIN